VPALLAFTLASTLLILSPGPDSLLVMRNTLRGGRRAGWVTATGTVSGLLVWAVAGALGLSALLRASHLGYDALRLAGGGYLIWLGIGSLRPRHRQQSGSVCTDRPGGPGSGEHRRWRAYLSGLLSNVLNPKVGVFFIAFLPAFIPAEGSAAMFSLGLGLWFAAETGAWLAFLAWLAARGVGWMRESAVRRWFERATGIVLIGFGLRLVTEAS
jgi:threonine/homoserine/homoserine lactone efflux protein